MRNADGKAADDVDERDKNGGDGIATDKFARAVHRAVEVSLALDVLAPRARLGFGDDTSVQFGIDGHLLAWHGVQGETGGNLGDAAGALGNHDEIDQHQNQEHHHPDDIIAADNEIAERLDHVACVPVQEDQARGRHVEREPEQREEEEQRGKAAEIGRLPDIKNHQQREQRHRDANGEQPVQ